MDKQREKFEEAFKNNNAYTIELIRGTNTPTFEQNSKGEYLKISVQNHWEMWRQAQKVAVPEGFVLVSSDTIRAIHFTCDLALDSKAVYRSALIEVRDALSEFAEKVEAQEN